MSGQSKLPATSHQGTAFATPHPAALREVGEPPWNSRVGKWFPFPVARESLRCAQVSGICLTPAQHRGRSPLSHGSIWLELKILVWFLWSMVCVCKAKDTAFPFTVVS